MMYKVGQFIDGTMVVSRSSKLQDLRNPATAKVIGQVAIATSQEIEQAVQSSLQAFETWSTTPALKRARVFFRFKELLEQNIEALADLVTQEHGKTTADAKGSVARGIELVEFICGVPNLLKGQFSQNVSTGVDTYTVRQPLGVCIGVSPFNFPVMVPIWMFANACATGNTFILKPSPQDPSAPLRLAELFSEAGAPPGVLNVLQGNKEVVDGLLAHPKVQAATAVASTAVAESIYKTAIQNGKRAHTFGGAKNHCVVMPDADITHSAEALLGAAFGSAGERCMAISVVVTVGDEVGDALSQALKTLVPKLRIGQGSDPAVDLGPLISEAHRQRVFNYIEQGCQEGATLLVDGRQVSVPGYEEGYFLGGTLFDNVLPSMRIYQEEIFGPVLCIVRVQSLEEAITLVNAHPYGNGTAILTQDGEAARTYCERVNVGLVGVNIPIPVPVAYHPFGGWKRSVFGDINMHGDQSIQFYTKLKTVTERWPKGLRAKAQYAMPTHE